MVADKLKVKVATLVLIFLAVSSVLLVFSYATIFIVSIIGFVYPTWKSFRALKDGVDTSQMQWLTYWVCYSSLQFADPLLSYLPYWTLLKIALYIWMMHPKTLGAKVLYDNVLKGAFKSQEDFIDAKLKQFDELKHDVLKTDHVEEELLADEPLGDRPHND